MASIASAQGGIRHVFVRDLVLAAVVGVHSHEQERAQTLRLNVDLAVAEDPARHVDELPAVVDYEAVVGRLRAVAASTRVSLVETLAERLAATCLEDPRVRAVRVRVEKLEAIAGLGSVGVEIERLNPAAAPGGQRG